MELHPSRPAKGAPDRAPGVDVLATAGSGPDVLATLESAPETDEPRAGLDVTAGEHGRELHARALDETLPGRVQPPAPSRRDPPLDATRQSGPAPAARKRVGLETTDASLPGSSRWQVLDEPVPRRIGRFAVLRRLGRGGMGTVYAGFDELLARRVALKVLHAAGYSGTDGRAHLVSEAQAMARLSHPNVVQVHELDATSDEVVLVMEYVEGRTLAAWLEERPRDWVTVVRQLLAAGRGLAAAHHAGLVHRDFKPENVLVGADDVPRVADFGLARAAADGAAQFAGTPAYMSPEQHLGARADARSDQYSFCVTLYEALYGQRPYAGETYDLLAAKVLGGELPPPPPATRVPAKLHAAIATGLALEPKDRHPSMDALLAALADLLPRPRRWPARLAVLALAAAVVLLAALLLRTPTRGVSPAALAAIARMTVEARTFAARAEWVYPGETTPARDTAVLRVVDIEHVAEPAATFARRHADALRTHFADELAALGEVYWGDPKTRPFARDFYAQALMFRPDHAPALRRASMSVGQLADLRDQAIAASFSPEQLAAVAPMKILADLDDPDRMARFAALSPGCPPPEVVAPDATGGDAVPAAPSDPAPSSDPPADSAPDDAVMGPPPPPGRQPRPSPPIDVEELLEQAENALRRGHDVESERLFSRVLAVSPRESTALAGLSDIAFDRGAFAEAARLAAQAARLAPDIAEHQTRLGDAYLKLARPADARARYERALALGDPRARRRLELLPAP